MSTAVIVCFISSLGVASPGAPPNPLHDGGSQGAVATGEMGRAGVNTGKQLGRATMGVLSALPQPVRKASGHVHLCFHGDPDTEFIKGVAAGTNQTDVAFSVWATPAWRRFLSHSTYHTRATHVMVGPRVWLLHWMNVIQEKTANNTISTQVTQWVFVSTEHKNTAFQHSLLRHIPEQLHFLLLQPLFSSVGRSMTNTREPQKGNGNDKGIQYNVAERAVGNSVKTMKNTPENQRGGRRLVEANVGVKEEEHRTKRQTKPMTSKERGASLENANLKPEDRAKKISQTLPQQRTPIGRGLLEVSRAEGEMKPLTPRERGTKINDPSLKITAGETKPAQTLPRREKTTLEDLDVVSRAKKLTKTMIQRDRKTKIENETPTPTERAERLSQTPHQRDDTNEKSIEVFSRAKGQAELSVLRDKESKLKDPSLKPVPRVSRLAQTVLQHSTTHAKFSSEGDIELLMAEYVGDGSAFFKKTGHWNNDSLWLFYEPLQATPATHFGGRTLTHTTIHKPGVFEPSSDGGMLKAGGYLADMMRDLEKHLNFTSRVIVTNTFGTLLENGSFNGMTGDLIRGEADLAPLDFSPSYTRYFIVDFSEWFSTDGIIIISRAPRPLMPPFLLLQVFPMWVWASVVMGGLLAGHALWGLNYIYHYKSSEKGYRDNTPTFSQYYRSRYQNHHLHHHHHIDSHSTDHQHNQGDEYHYPSYWETLAVVFKLFVVQSSDRRKWGQLWSSPRSCSLWLSPSWLCTKAPSSRSWLCPARRHP
ncbi:uncharacterized protein LOC126983870 isoform X2 [Eriocheir sinensis]|uniref:uncharacterized protein LOC126983870 isoform X2 n=1 Tax=Eriocheir sinensis TaxID=95602 RepID=UPI0021CADC87|nr:uncharacterized protein LOC126983870 isoform X2 [Eriocheir sinensis]XP_050692978.1 uncharacterized protein LOC126983870 isoform X2 [Eriocheir sinensis]